MSLPWTFVSTLAAQIPHRLGANQYLLKHQKLNFWCQTEHDLRDNVALILVVEPLEQGTLSRPQRLVLGNIHVLFNPKRGEA